MNYNEIDHVHCWNDKKPPCGQKIEHLKCCLCEKLNPKVIDRASTLAVLMEGVKAKEVETNGTVGEYEFQLEVVDFPDGTKKKKAPGFTTAYNEALDDILEILQETLGEK